MMKDTRSADAIQVMRGSDVDLTARDRRRAEAIVLEVVSGEDLELHSCFDDRGDPVFVGGVDLSVRHHRRRAINAGGKAPWAPNSIARLGVEAPHDAHVADDVEELSIGCGG